MTLRRFQDSTDHPIETIVDVAFKEQDFVGFQGNVTGIRLQRLREPSWERGKLAVRRLTDRVPIRDLRISTGTPVDTMSACLKNRNMSAIISLILLQLNRNFFVRLQTHHAPGATH